VKAVILRGVMGLQVEDCGVVCTLCAHRMAALCDGKIVSVLAFSEPELLRSRWMRGLAQDGLLLSVCCPVHAPAKPRQLYNRNNEYI